MSDNIMLSINASIGREASKKVEGLENKVKESMRGVRDGNWLDTTDDGLFRASIGGVLLDVGADSEDGIKLMEAVGALRSLNAFISAASMGLDPQFPEIPEEVLPLLSWWEEIKTEK